MTELVYQPPWLCYEHKYIAKNAADFMTHIETLPHYREGSDGTCEKCQKHIGHFKILHETINEPLIILCPDCEKIPNVKEFIRAKRRSQYPNMMTI